MKWLVGLPLAALFMITLGFGVFYYERVIALVLCLLVCATIGPLLLRDGWQSVVTWHARSHKSGRK